MGLDWNAMSKSQLYGIALWKSRYNQTPGNSNNSERLVFYQIFKKFRHLRTNPPENWVFMFLNFLKKVKFKNLPSSSSSKLFVRSIMSKSVQTLSGNKDKMFSTWFFWKKIIYQQYSTTAIIRETTNYEILAYSRAFLWKQLWFLKFQVQWRHFSF